MIAVDTKVLVYAHRSDSPFHVPAERCLRVLAQGRAPWAIAWPCLHEFYSVVTHPRIFKQPTSAERACEQIDAWLESASLQLLTETGEHWRALGELLKHGNIRRPMVHDARIAAICLGHGVHDELWTADRDFSQFPQLRIRNPLKQDQA